VYTKAALFFHALRQEIGDEAFFEALQNYYQAEKYGIALPDDLLTAFEQASGRPLEPFYKEWLYAPEK
jgi:aminopeptidase N